MTEVLTLSDGRQLSYATARRWEGANHYSFVDRESWIEFVSAARDSASP